MPSSPPTPAPRRVIVLGSTGSIGLSTLAVIEHLTRTGQRPFEVVGLAAGHNVKLLAEQARHFNCPAVAVAAPLLDAPQRDALKPCASTFIGPDAARQLVEQVEADVVVAAIVGVAGLPATVAAIERGRIVALANKETLVAAGELVMPMVQRFGAALVPIDSEHSAVWQCLGRVSGEWGLVSGEKTPKPSLASGPYSPAPTHHSPPPRRIVLTASGGPFRDTPPEVMAQATPEQALQHPTWDMGPKITIDSATMMNKALEVIEAHHLFQLPGEKIDVLIHPQSVVHGMVEFADHSVLAQMGPPDMRTPIQVALTHPDRLPGCSDQLDWNKLRQLDFYPPDGERFPALKLAYEVIRRGGTAGAVVNAANEVAVAAFLERRIRFGRIVEVVRATLTALPTRPVASLADIMAADAEARAHADSLIESSTVSEPA